MTPQRVNECTTSVSVRSKFKRKTSPRGPSLGVSAVNHNSLFHHHSDKVSAFSLPTLIFVLHLDSMARSIRFNLPNQTQSKSETKYENLVSPLHLTILIKKKKHPLMPEELDFRMGMHQLCQRLFVLLSNQQLLFPLELAPNAEATWSSPASPILVSVRKAFGLALFARSLSIFETLYPLQKSRESLPMLVFCLCYMLFPYLTKFF
jgi:hypothetical protein